MSTFGLSLKYEDIDEEEIEELYEPILLFHPGLFAPAFNPGEYRWTCCRHPDPKDPGCRKVDADEHIDGKDPNRHKIPNQIHKIKAHKPHKMKKPHLHHKDKDRKEKDHGGEEELDFD